MSVKYLYSANSGR